jgi:ubiquinone/menaquinone biosynthesis C-methylase UbiE
MVESLKAMVQKNALLNRLKAYARTRPLLLSALRSSSQGKYDQMVARINSYCGGLKGKSVLELGCNTRGDFIGDVARHYPLKEGVGINICLRETYRLSPTLRLQPGDIRKMEFDDSYFDVLISSAVFEHLHDFSIALREMYRVLKPGGFVYSHFGPIWSGSYGHHLWLEKDGQLFTYHNTLLPPYCHLLMTPEQVMYWLREQDHPYSREITDYVFRSPDQNHLMFSDYEKLMRSSPFKIVFLKGYDFDKLQQVYAAATTAEMFQNLMERYPADRDRFLYDGITVLLHKS